MGKKEEQEKKGDLFEDKQRQDNSFETIHTVVASSANVRAEPSLDGEIIAIVEQGMNLDIIEENQDWSKVVVFEKTGWIFTNLIKSEVQERH